MLHLRYRPPFDWPAMLRFFALRATPGVERVADGRYWRTISLRGKQGILEVGPGTRKSHLSLVLHGPGCDGSGARSEIARRSRDVFDLDAPVAQIRLALSRDEDLRGYLQTFPGIRVPGAWDGFELTVRAILGQQVSVKAATTLAGRIAARYGEPLAVDGASLSRVFPEPAKLRRAGLKNLGLVTSRAETIRRVACAVQAGELHFETSQEPSAFCTSLRAIKGIGDWTAQYVAMRVLKHADAFPESDLGLLKALTAERSTPAYLRQRAEAWRPWRAYAAMLMWSSLPGSGG